jgi:dienelactone hydrolase
VDKYAWLLIGVASLLIVGATGLEVAERTLFPVWEPNPFEKSPAALGPYEVVEKDFTIGASTQGENYGATVFIPKSINGRLPLFVWVTGSNVQDYYQLSLHKTLASWGYMVIVPEAPKFSFTNPVYHEEVLELAIEATENAIEGGYGYEIDSGKIAAGGYSVGASLAAFLAAKEPEIDALVYWGPSGSPYWLGVNAKKLYSEVTEPALYVLGESDDSAPPRGGYPDKMGDLMPRSDSEVRIIEGGVHHYFQQPTGLDNFTTPTKITRFEQQKIAINATRNWLNKTFKTG